MTAAEAMLDAVITRAIWQRDGLRPEQIAAQLRCRQTWDAIEAHIVLSHLLPQQSAQWRAA